MYVHWWSDSGNVHTCHKNEPGLSAQDSLLATVQYRDDGCEPGWYYVQKDFDTNCGPFASLSLVKQAVEKTVGGAQIPV